MLHVSILSFIFISQVYPDLIHVSPSKLYCLLIILSSYHLSPSPIAHSSSRHHILLNLPYFFFSLSSNVLCPPLSFNLLLLSLYPLPVSLSSNATGIYLALTVIRAVVSQVTCPCPSHLSSFRPCLSVWWQWGLRRHWCPDCWYCRGPLGSCWKEAGLKTTAVESENERHWKTHNSQLLEDGGNKIYILEIYRKIPFSYIVWPIWEERSWLRWLTVIID